MSRVNAYERVLGALETRGAKIRRRGGGIVAQCPAHDDGNPSLSVTHRPGSPGRALLHCHAGCQTVDVLGALGLTMADTFDEPAVYRYDSGREVVRSYDRADGKKSILQRDTKAPAELWRLSRVREAVAAGADVWIAEGEEDALTLDALAGGLRIAATTAPMGASNWSRVDYSVLAGTPVVIVADNDAAGVGRAVGLADHLETIGVVVRGVVTAHEPHNDVTEALAAWAKEAPMTFDDLRNETVAGYRARVGALVGTVETVEVAGLGERSRFVEGGSFILDAPTEAVAIWGDAHCVAWAAGESLLIYAPPGLGKTTLTGMLVRARLGITSEVLGMPVQPTARRILYLAMDRPQQIARALGRQFGPSDRRILDERLVVRLGPLSADLAAVPTLLRDLAREVGADTLIVDSLKDAQARLSEDSGGQAYNIARQHAIADGIEVVELHHARKATADGRRGLTLDDVYGSVWITAGAGSVIALIGEAGETSLEVRGVKTPSGELGPLRVRVDHDRGEMHIASAPSVLGVLAGQGALMAKNVAQLVHGREDVSRAETERARRELDSLVAAGRVESVKLAAAHSGGRPPSAYRLASERLDVS